MGIPVPKGRTPIRPGQPYPPLHDHRYECLAHLVANRNDWFVAALAVGLPTDAKMLTALSKNRKLKRRIKTLQERRYRT